VCAIREVLRAIPHFHEGLEDLQKVKSSVLGLCPFHVYVLNGRRRGVPYSKVLFLRRVVVEESVFL
jgi:hypothetical protein